MKGRRDTYLERDAHLYPTLGFTFARTWALDGCARPSQRGEVVPDVPPPEALVYDDVFER